MNWETEKLYFSGDEYFAAVIEKINGATQFIQMETYIFDVDEIGMRVLVALGNAVKRGVQVHVMVDGVGSINSLAKLKAAVGMYGFQLRVYHPIPFIEGGLKRLSVRSLKILFGLFQTINKRNHRKVINIDGTSAFVGSFNVSRVHAEEFSGAQAWNDAAVYVEGSAIRELTRAFSKAWLQYRVQLFPLERRLPRLPAKPETKLVRLNSRIYWRYAFLNDLVRRLSSAQKRIFISNAYFLPKGRILRALQHAARRGVEVGICLPDKSDVWIVKAAAKNLYYHLIQDGVKIFEYQPTMLHAKTILVDDWATVGSHNFNNRSFVHDLEADVVITRPENIEELLLKWNDDIGKSKRVGIADLGKINLWARIINRIAFWFRYWI